MGAPSLEEYLSEIRKEGWAVAAHYDYKTVGGEKRTYWFFARDGVCVEGSGETDTDAVLEALIVIERKATADAQVQK